MTALVVGAATSDLLLYLIAGFGLLGGIGSGIKAFLDRRTVKSKANADNASASAILTSAARELVDPLRQELATERAEHAEEIEIERLKVAEVRKELDSVLSDLSSLRAALRRAFAEAEEARERERVTQATLEESKRRILELEEEIRRLSALPPEDAPDLN